MKKRRLWAWILTAAMLVAAVPTAHAKSSDEIRAEINDLQKAAQDSQDRMAELEAQLNDNWASIEEMVAYKNDIDEQIFLLYSVLDNLDQQITAYTELIAATQEELDLAQAELDALNQKYKGRIRAMEEAGELSYWTVIFKATSFTDLIDRLNMMQEIAEADQRMMDQLQQATQTVADSKAKLEQEKVELEASRTAQEEAWTEMEEKRAEADRILAELYADHQNLELAHDHFSEENDAILNQIAQAEKAFYEAQKAEEAERQRQEEERRRQEEEERRRREEEERQNQATAPTEPEETEPAATEPEQTEPEATQPQETTPSTTEPEETQPEETEPEETEPEQTEPEETEPEETKPPADSGWKVPCSYTYISSPYGYRSGGWHNGVDFAAPRGTPIYATRSGTVTTATALKNSKGQYISYGNYVVINHGDGYSSLYAHMDYYVVSAGDYVTQGQLIGYVGSTGNSSGNHLHLTFFYMGSTVNPMNYL